MKRYDTTFRFAEVVLKKLGWSSNEITDALTDDMVRHLADCTAEQRNATFEELNAARLRSLEEDDDVPLVMKSADFRCSQEDCGHEMRDQIIDIPKGSPLSRATMECEECGADATYFIPPGTRFAVQGEENVPSERLDAARRGLIRNPPPGFEPYKGDGTRRDLESWERKHDLSPMSADEGKRGNAVINSKKKHTQTAAFEEQLASTVTKAWEIAEAGGDRLAEAKAGVDAPNEYDANTFKQQVNQNIVDGDVAVADGAIPVEAVAEEITAKP